MTTNSSEVVSWLSAAFEQGAPAPGLHAGTAAGRLVVVLKVVS